MSDFSIKHSLRVLAHLLSYPDAALREALPELADALAAEGALSWLHRQPVLALMNELAHGDPYAVEARYVVTFDRGRATSLHLFEHVHADSRDRGQAMVDLLQTYAAAGLALGPHELPDFLPVVLEFASTQPPALAREFLGEMAHLLRAVHSALVERDSPYACALASVLALAGQAAALVAVTPEPALDDAWAEPEPFGGCSSQGQAGPQPIHLVRGTVGRASQGARA